MTVKSNGRKNRPTLVRIGDCAPVYFKRSRKKIQRSTAGFWNPQMELDQSVKTMGVKGKSERLLVFALALMAWALAFLLIEMTLKMSPQIMHSFSSAIPH